MANLFKSLAPNCLLINGKSEGKILLKINLPGVVIIKSPTFSPVAAGFPI